MKPSNSLLLALLVLVLPCVAQQIPVASSIAYEGTNSSNNIVLTWESIPTKLYHVLTTTALGPQPWQQLNASPIYSSNNLVRYRDTNNQPARFYQVVKVDTDPPEIWRLNPGSNATAVALQNPLKAWLRDETAIDPSSLVLTVGTNPPATLADPRLAYTNGTLTYTPATNQFLGTNGQTVTATLVFSDTLGHRATNAWPFSLELAPVLASTTVLIGNPSGAGFRPASDPSLTLVSTNGDTYVFSYTGPSSGLTNGQVLVSTDTNSPYKRRILSLTDNPAAHTVSLVTTQASLAECLQGGSVRLVGDFSQPPPSGGFQPASDGTGISLDGTVLYDNGTVRLEVTSGEITFDPDFTVSGTFAGGRLTTFDAEVSGTVALDMTLQVTAQVTGNFDDSQPLVAPRRTFKLLGFVGIVPVWVEAVLEFNIGYEASLEATGTATWGFESSRTLTVGTTLRNGQWSHNEQQTATLTPMAPAWQISGQANLQIYLQPKLTVYLESLAGLSVDLKPYLELEGNASVEPGRAGVELSAYAGLSSTLAVDVRGWDSAWGALPSWELFNLRERIYHRSRTTPSGTPVQTIPNMVWIPAGTFTMGSPASEPARRTNEGPQTRVTISQGVLDGKIRSDPG